MHQSLGDLDFSSWKKNLLPNNDVRDLANPEWWRHFIFASSFHVFFSHFFVVSVSNEICCCVIATAALGHFRNGVEVFFLSFLSCLRILSSFSAIHFFSILIKNLQLYVSSLFSFQSNFSIVLSATFSKPISSCSLSSKEGLSEFFATDCVCFDTSLIMSDKWGRFENRFVPSRVVTVVLHCFDVAWVTLRSS